MNNNNPAPLTLVAADDHRLFLEGIGSLLKRSDDLKLLAVCEDGDRLLALVATHRPDIVLLDISMPGATAEVVIETIAGQYPDTRVIAVTMHLDAVLADSLFARGLAGYVSKSDAFDELGEAIAAIRQNRRYLSPALDAGGSGEATASLSTRELSVLRCAASGQNNREIAAALKISERTVRFHLNNCCEKLCANGRANAIALAMQKNLIRL